MPTLRRMKVDPYLALCTETRSNWIKDFSLNPKTLKLQYPTKYRGRKGLFKQVFICQGTKENI